MVLWFLGKVAPSWSHVKRAALFIQSSEMSSTIHKPGCPVYGICPVPTDNFEEDVDYGGSNLCDQDV